MKLAKFMPKNKKNKQNQKRLILNKICRANGENFIVY